MPLEYVKSQKNQNQLVYDGFRFVREKIRETKITWKCVEYKTSGCKSRIHTEGDKILSYCDAHNHVPQSAQIRRKQIISEIKERARSTVESPQLIMARAAEITSPVVQSSLQSLNALKKTIQRTRRIEKYPMSNPKSLSELELRKDFTRTTGNEKFLLFDSGPDESRILLFSTANNLKILKEAKHIYADGTFKTAPSLFSQFFTIHASVKKITVLTVFVLLPNKTETTYNRMLLAVKQLTQDLNPQTITTDFELGLLNAFKSAFPTSRQKGCYFHFRQCIWRKIQQIPQLVANYKSDPEFAANIRCLASLAFVPATNVIKAFDELQDSDFYTENDNLRTLTDYFEDTWIGKMPRRGNRRTSKFPIALWNVNEATKNGESRTNNLMEGWHRGFSFLMGADHPVIWKFIDYLKNEQNLVEFKYQQAIAGFGSQAQRKVYKDCAERIRKIVVKYDSQHIMTYLKSLALNIELNV